MENNFDKLSELDKLIFINNTNLCKTCPGYDLCQQTIKGIYPVIRQTSITKDWVLIDKSCGKIRGECYSYVDIKLYDDIYKSGNRAGITKHLLKNGNGFIYGPGGHGKSYTLGYIANELNKLGKSIYFDLANLISIEVANYDTKDLALQDIQKADVLIIDDFAGEKMTSHIIFNVWIPILKNRLDNNKATYISSNYNLEQIAERITKATDKMTSSILLDRINKLGTINFKDKNYRL